MNDKRRRTCLLIAMAAAVGGMILPVRPVSSAPVIVLDSAEKSVARNYIELPAFARSRANTGVAVHDIADTKLLDAVKDVGFSFIRADLFWSEVDTKDGWQFSRYDTLVSDLAARGLGALFILGYGNDLYGPHQPPTTPLQLAGFSRYVHESVSRYRDADVRFEVWNEEDSKSFWLTEPSPAAYGQLLNTALRAAKSANPDAVVAMGGVQQVNRDFIRAVGNVWQVEPDAVSVHPYRQEEPESVFSDYRHLSQDLAAYRKVPAIWATEWSYPSYGYSYVADIADGHSPEARARQARYVVRRFLTDWIAQIGLTAYYDIRNDGANPKNMENNFGLLDSDNTRLPAYDATKYLFSFTKDVTRARYFIDIQNKYVILKLNSPHATRYVAWCYGRGNGIRLDISQLPGNARATDMYGTRLVPEGGAVTAPETLGPVFISVAS
ncbi:glycosyl hydrolase family 5 [Paraburkholderia bryophila]|uniref:Cellulase (Glycosyl hydrolase family 5) n=1 Tax=Paraburkholderia bryophila TaxID=420952 RepID=A0A7Y9WWC3_9BURK|nr:glycosyl hydrolase family 5 [Paraburkholderia bryophila]NYH27173.1 hypothetical protein [Paraburkholderia bryophila]